MTNKEQPKIAMLDTSFLIRLLKEDDLLHASAKEYYQYFLENHYVLYVSTVAVAEYCVRGTLDQLPFESVRVIPFNLDHAEREWFFCDSCGHSCPHLRILGEVVLKFYERKQLF